MLAKANFIHYNNQNIEVNSKYLEDSYILPRTIWIKGYAQI